MMRCARKGLKPVLFFYREIILISLFEDFSLLNVSRGFLNSVFLRLQSVVFEFFSAKFQNHRNEESKIKAIK